MSYQYTYPADLSYLDVLPPTQRALAVDVLDAAGQNGADLRDALHAVSASAEDKAAVAEVFGGDAAGDEFL